MFLSKLCLNVRNADVRRQLREPYEMHRTLWSTGFGHLGKDELGRVLFRIDTDRSGIAPVLLVQSDHEPDWSRFPNRFVIERPQCKRLEISLAQGQAVRFRLRANPTKKVGTSLKEERLSGKKENGRRVSLLHEEDQVAWLVHKGEEGGFRIPGQWVKLPDGRTTPDFRVEAAPEGWVRCSKNGHSAGRFFAVRFDGLLEVTNAEQFLATVRSGIGSAKGFGFGLLSLAPASGS
jgi:CRISPR system Cascade subunit CasE